MNKKLIYAVGILILLAGAISLNIVMTKAGDAAAPTDTQKIAIVNVQRLLSESKAAKSIQSQLESQREQFKEEFSEQERKLVQEHKEFGLDNAADMTPEKLAEQRQAFEKELIETRGEVQKKRRAMELAASKAMNDLRKEITVVVAKLADENGYDLVITRQNVVLASKELEITDQVMAGLNNNIKEIKLNLDIESQ